MKYELEAIVFYSIFIAVLGVLVTSSAQDGFFGNPIDKTPSPLPFNITDAGNITVTGSGSVLEPPKCEPVFSFAIPVVDHVGCLGAIMLWLNGFRDYGSTSIWFFILFILPVVIISGVFAYRLLKPAGT